MERVIPRCVKNLLFSSRNLPIKGCVCVCVCVWVTQSGPALCHSMNCSPPGSSVLGILQARILERLAIPFSRGSSQPRDWTRVYHTAGRFFTVFTREAHQGIKTPHFTPFGVWFYFAAAEFFLAFTFFVPFSWSFIKRGICNLSSSHYDCLEVSISSRN